MGSRGPVPKRTDQRRRENKPEIPVTEAPAAPETSAPAPGDDWHPAALAWYLSLEKSGQSKFYEPSDWATAWIVAESMSRDLGPKVLGLGIDGPVMGLAPLTGASLSAYLRSFAVLLVTEGDRRRASVELVRAKPKELPDGVTDLDEIRRRLSG